MSQENVEGIIPRFDSRASVNVAPTPKTLQGSSFEERRSQSAIEKPTPINFRVIPSTNFTTKKEEM